MKKTLKMVAFATIFAFATSLMAQNKFIGTVRYSIDAAGKTQEVSLKIYEDNALFKTEAAQVLVKGRKIYNMQDLSFMDASLRDMKAKLLSGIQQLAANPNRSKEATEYLYKALILFGIFWDEEGMVPILNDLEKMTQKNR
jgi:hypothetical protein